MHTTNDYLIFHRSALDDTPSTVAYYYPYVVALLRKMHTIAAIFQLSQRSGDTGCRRLSVDRKTLIAKC